MSTLHLGEIPYEERWKSGGILALTVELPPADASGQIRQQITVHATRWFSYAEMERDHKELEAIRKRMKRQNRIAWLTAAILAAAFVAALALKRFI
jgi:hypothetical protein